MSLSPNFARSPLAVVIGCGDLAMGTARRLGLGHPLLIADIDPGKLETAGAALRAEGYAVTLQVCDITDPESVAALSAKVPAQGIRALAHVAALAPSAGDFRKIMRVNLIGPHLVAPALLPHCRDGSAIVLVSSLAGHGVRCNTQLDAILDKPLGPDFLDQLETALGPEKTTPQQAYMLSKYALIRYAERLAVRWGQKGVRVVSVSPGLVLTSMGARERAYSPVSRTLAAKTPLKRESSILEIVEVIDFAASDRASFLNGIEFWSMAACAPPGVGRRKRKATSRTNENRSVFHARVRSKEDLPPDRGEARPDDQPAPSPAAAAPAAAQPG